VKSAASSAGSHFVSPRSGNHNLLFIHQVNTKNMVAVVIINHSWPTFEHHTHGITQAVITEKVYVLRLLDTKAVGKVIVRRGWL
jgi:hypothetical protein